MTVNNFIVDSSAWIEYLKGSSSGKKVKKIIENASNNCFTPSIVLGEVVSKVEKTVGDSEIVIKVIKMFSRQPKEEWHYYFESGLLHAKLRNEFNDVSLADAIIKIIAEKNNARIITKDKHLKSKNTIFI